MKITSQVGLQSGFLICSDWKNFPYRLLHYSDHILVDLLMRMQFATILFSFMSFWMVSKYMVIELKTLFLHVHAVLVIVEIIVQLNLCES